MEMSEVLGSKSETTEGKSNVIYCLESALSAMWLPAVIGSHPLTFISASLDSDCQDLDSAAGRHPRLLISSGNPSKALHPLVQGGQSTNLFFFSNFIRT